MHHKYTKEVVLLPPKISSMIHLYVAISCETFHNIKVCKLFAFKKLLFFKVNNICKIVLIIL